MTQPGTRTVPFQDPRNNHTPLLIGVIIPAVLALLLVLFNWDEVSLNILAWGVDVPLGLVLLLLYVLGLVTGRLLQQRQETAGPSRVRVVTRNDAQ
jgi:uncharacterized integral membrane protein